MVVCSGEKKKTRLYSLQETTILASSLSATSFLDNGLIAKGLYSATYTNMNTTSVSGHINRYYIEW